LEKENRRRIVFMGGPLSVHNARNPDHHTKQQSLPAVFADWRGGHMFVTYRIRPAFVAERRIFEDSEDGRTLPHELFST